MHCTKIQFLNFGKECCSSFIMQLFIFFNSWINQHDGFFDWRIQINVAEYSWFIVSSVQYVYHTYIIIIVCKEHHMLGYQLSSQPASLCPLEKDNPTLAVQFFGLFFLVECTRLLTISSSWSGFFDLLKSLSFGFSLQQSITECSEQIHFLQITC